MALRLYASDKFIPTWNDNREQPEKEQISLEYHLMSVEDVFKVQREKGVDLLVGINPDLRSQEDMSKYWQMITAVLEEYTFNYRNIFFDGKELTDIKEITKKCRMNHMQLMAEIFNKVLVSSVGFEDDVKNSNTDSDVTSEESTTLATTV